MAAPGSGGPEASASRIVDLSDWDGASAGAGAEESFTVAAAGSAATGAGAVPTLESAVSETCPEGTAWTPFSLLKSCVADAAGPPPLDSAAAPELPSAVAASKAAADMLILNLELMAVPRRNAQS